MKKSIFIIPFFVILLFSCSTTTPPTPDPKLGDVWVVRYSDYNEDLSLAGQQDISITTTEIVFNNESWVQLNSPLGSLGIYKMKSDGLHQLDAGNLDELFLPFPGTVGDSCMYHLNGENYKNKLDITNTSASLIGGMYNGVNQYSQYDANSIEGTILFTANEWFVKYIEFDEKVISPPGMFMDYNYEIVSYTAN